MNFTVSFNYCKKCRKFRKLFSQENTHSAICSNCLGFEPKQLEQAKLSKPKPIKPPKSIKPPKPLKNQHCSIIKKLRLAEEEILYPLLKDANMRKKQYWKKELADKIGWNISKVSAVARRLERKGKIEKKESDSLVIELLKNNPEGLTPREMQKSLNFSSMLSLYNTLQNLLKKGKIIRKRTKNDRHSVYIMIQ